MYQLGSELLPVFNGDIELLKQHLLYAGFIPEVYAHDSSEEKAYAKYYKVLVCSFFHHLGFESTIRSNG